MTTTERAQRDTCCRVAQMGSLRAQLARRMVCALRFATWALALSCVLPVGRAHADGWSYGTFVVSPSSLRIEQLVARATPFFVPVSERSASQLQLASGISVPWWETRGGIRASEILGSEMIACSVALHRRGFIGTLKFRF